MKLPCSILSSSTTNTYTAQIFVRYQVGDKTNKIRRSFFRCCNRKCLNTMKDTWYKNGKLPCYHATFHKGTFLQKARPERPNRISNSIQEEIMQYPVEKYVQKKPPFSSICRKARKVQQMSLVSPVFGEKMYNSFIQDNSIFMTKTCISGAI